MKKTVLTLLGTIFLIPCALWAETPSIFVVHEYSFDASSNPNVPEIAHSLCGTRCNAISGSFSSYMMPGGWRLVKTSTDKRIVLDIATPFIEGKCICVGEEYLVTKDIPLPATPLR